MTLLEQLAQELARAGGSAGGGMQFASKAGTVGTTVAYPYQFGPLGLWGVAGVSRDVISTRVMPRGLGGMLPARPTNEINPIYPFLTGFTAADTSKAATPCDDPPTAGAVKNCLTTVSFGRYSYQTSVLDVTRLGQQINRGEFQDLVIINDPVYNPSDGTGPLTQPGMINNQTKLANELRIRMIELGIAFQNALIPQVWQGNPINNNGGGGYAEFPGLDLLITTGHKDALSGASCPSLDSLIYDFKYNRVDAAGVGTSLITYLTYMARQLKHNSIRMNMDPVQWAICMREELFYEVTQVWACTYSFTRCDVGMFPNTTVDRVVVDGNDINEFRDEMRNGQYLVIDGVKWPVVFDDGIHLDTNGTNGSVTAGCFSSDIYFVPITARGGYGLLYWEYFDFAGPNALFNLMGDGSMPGYAGYFWSDGGRYAWHAKPPTNWCIQYLSTIMPRLVLRAPHMAARLKNVQFCPFAMTREPFPTDPYYVNGGNTAGRPAPSLYKEYSDPTPFL